MSYGIKYSSTYKRLSGGFTTIDILENGYTGTITSLIAAGSPLEISFAGDVDNIYTPTVGSGAVVSVVSTPGKLTDLFTDDPQKFMVKCYNGNSGSNLFWQGFVCTEIYNEDYTKPNTEIKIQCNDGIKVLEYLPYMQDEEIFYTGTTTIGEILGNVFSKINLTFNNLYTNSDLKVYWDEDVNKRNLFAYLYLARENFINEQGVAMSCREVLNSIFGGLGLVVKFKGNNIYIINPENLNSTDNDYWYSTTYWGGYETASPFSSVLDISNNNIAWYKTGTQKDLVAAASEVTIKYDPYTGEKYAYDFSNSDNWSVAGSFISATGGSTPFYVNENIRYNGWTTTGTARNEIGIKEESTDTPVFGFALYSDLAHTGNTMSYTFPFSNFVNDRRMNIKVSFDVYIQTRANTTNIFCVGTVHDIYKIQLPYSLTVTSANNTWYYNNSYGYQTTKTATSNILPLTVIQEGISNINYDQSRVNDTWTAASAIIKGFGDDDDLVEGNITITIYNILHNFFSQQIQPSTNGWYVYIVLIKNVKVEFLDALTGQVIDNGGISTTVSVNRNLTKKSALEIKTTSGTGLWGSSKGAFKTDIQELSGSNIEGLARGTGTTLYSTSKLIGQSVISQYKKPRTKLTGSLNAVNYLTNLDLHLIKESNYEGYKAFYIVNGTYNDKNESFDAELIEITSTLESLE